MPTQASQGIFLQQKPVLHRTLCILAVLVMITSAAGCSGGFLSFLSPTLTQAAIEPTATTEPTPQSTEIAGTAEPAATPTPSSSLLKIWLPPQFDPQSGTAAGDLLSARISQFERDNPGIQVDVRVKSANGPASLIDSLGTASAAAPGVLPDLVALPRSDMETGALKGLLIPLDGLTTMLKEEDWYPYARQLATIQGSTFGVPFAGDAMVLLYRPSLAGQQNSDWQSVLSQHSACAFPAADFEAMLTLALYQASGGLIQDDQNRPSLQEKPLEAALKIYATGIQNGVFPLWLAQYETDGQSWQAYQEKRSQLVITWISRYLTELPPDTMALPLPPVGGTSLTLATGWVWSIPKSGSEPNPLSIKLMEYLTAGDFLGAWNAAAGLMPTRASALVGWKTPTLTNLLGQVVLSAQAVPQNDILVTLGPVLRDAALEMFKGSSDPVQVAQAAIERLNRLQ